MRDELYKGWTGKELEQLYQGHRSVGGTMTLLRDYPIGELVVPPEELTAQRELLASSETGD